MESRIQNQKSASLVKAKLKLLKV